jgi:predicted aminopeptidase
LIVTRFSHHCLFLLACLLLGSCQTAKFYGQAVGGQLEIFRKSRPIPPIIADSGADPKLRCQLVAVQGIRQFASEHLTLAGDESYGNYADLGRKYVTWVLYAAPEFSLKPKTWWYPTLGHLEYRGFFREADAHELADQLRARGHDVEVGGVEAYSTLGWFHDPVLNCFVHKSEIALAELIFHELTHRRLFRNGDTAFNESLATAFAEECVKRWLRHQNRSADLRKYQQLLVRRNQFYDKIDVTRVQLEALYASGKTEGEMRREKAALLADLQQNFRELRRRWGGSGLESWLTQDLNNAHLVSIITYQKNVPLFHRLLAECGGDIDLFFKRAAKLDLAAAGD